MTEFYTSEIQELARASEWRKPGAVTLVGLEGPLGAGKTTFTRELLRSLGLPGTETVQSPTFLKLIAYDLSSFGRVCHLDAYRTAEPHEWDRVGLETYADARLWLVEWPETFFAFLRFNPALRALLGLKNARVVEWTMNGDATRTIGNRILDLSVDALQ